jgi:hypothetical protein
MAPRPRTLSSILTDDAFTRMGFGARMAPREGEPQGDAR